MEADERRDAIVGATCASSKPTKTPLAASSKIPARVNKAAAAAISTIAMRAKSTVNAVARPRSERMGGRGVAEVAYGPTLPQLRRRGRGRESAHAAIIVL